MSLLASKLGIMEKSLRDLYQGKADILISSRLGVMRSALQEFLNGKANIQMAAKMGLLTSALQKMLDDIGQKGAIGIVIGLLICRHQQEG
jgi:hypothetical protein